MSRRRVVVVVVLSGVAGALLLTTRGAADRQPHSVESGVLRVESTSCGSTMLGSGFLVDHRHLLTAAHVVDDAGTISLGRGGRVLAHGTIVGADRARDVALIRLDRSISGHALALSRRASRPGEDVVAAGYPNGGPLTMARGSVRGIATTIPSSGAVRRPLIQTDAAVGHGESGGPLVSGAEGEVLGMLDMSSIRKGASLAVGAGDLAPLIARWRSDPEAVPQRPCPASGGYPTLLEPSPRSGAASPPPAHM